MITLTSAKEHLRVDHADEDMGITALIAAAEAHLIEIGVTIPVAPAIRPASLDHAVLLLVGHWYANREAVITGTIASTVPMAFDALVAPHRGCVI
jgi:Phage gp6-like head-tail connector protein